MTSVFTKKPISSSISGADAVGDGRTNRKVFLPAVPEQHSLVGRQQHHEERHVFAAGQFMQFRCQVGEKRSCGTSRPHRWGQLAVDSPWAVPKYSGPLRAASSNMRAAGRRCRSPSSHAATRRSPRIECASPAEATDSLPGTPRKRRQLANKPPHRPAVTHDMVGAQY